MPQYASYPTPAGAAHSERMNHGFLKLHPGAPVHVFTECHDAEFHTHPFTFTTHIVAGGYTEEVLVRQPDGRWQVLTLERRPGTSHDMPVGVAHRLTGLLDGPVCVTRCEYGLTTQKAGFVRPALNGQWQHRYWDETEWREWPRA